MSVTVVFAAVVEQRSLNGPPLLRHYQKGNFTCQDSHQRAAGSAANSSAGMSRLSSGGNHVLSPSHSHLCYANYYALLVRHHAFPFPSSRGRKQLDLLKGTPWSVVDLLLLVAGSCHAQGAQEYRVLGEIKELADGTPLYLINGNQQKVIDSTTVAQQR